MTCVGAFARVLMLLRCSPMHASMANADPSHFLIRRSSAAAATRAAGDFLQLQETQVLLDLAKVYRKEGLLHKAFELYHDTPHCYL